MDEKKILTKLGMCVVSVKANDLHAIWWSDLKTSVLFADFLVKIGIFFSVLKSVFRIRSDPYHLAGSGSASGNVDLDPGTKKKS